MSTLQTCTNYQYRPLEHPNDIRILALLPASDYQARLTAEIVHVNRDAILQGISEPSDYEAISYCWGNPTLSHSLFCDNGSTHAITRNVDVMLRYLRRPHRTRYLWIDAICLNQEDPAEKDVQVRLMGSIYQEAAKVHIWLGEADQSDCVPSIFATLKTVAIRASREPDDLTTQQLHQELVRICGHEYRFLFRKFFSRPWFTRRWVLQEAAFGRDITVRCGRHKLSWSWFIDGIDRLYSGELQDHAVPELQFLSAAKTVLSIKQSSEQNLLYLLWDHHLSACSMAEDRIFAIYNMASDSRDIVQIDHTKHWTEIYTHVAKAYLRTPSNCQFMLQHLLCFGPLSQVCPKYPSWIPNWTNHRGPNHLIWTPKDAQAQALPDIFWGLRWYESKVIDNARLRIRASKPRLSSDTVAEVAKVIPSLDDAAEVLIANARPDITLFAKVLLASIVNMQKPLLAAKNFGFDPNVSTFREEKTKYLCQAIQDILRNKLGHVEHAELSDPSHSKGLKRDDSIAYFAQHCLDRLFTHNTLFSLSQPVPVAPLIGIGPLDVDPGDEIIHYSTAYGVCLEDTIGIGLIIRPLAPHTYQYIGICFIPSYTMSLSGPKSELIDLV